MALLQFEDGTFYDENAVAIAGKDKYELIATGEGSQPLAHACEERQHEFDEDEIRANYLDNASKPLICDACGLSVHTIAETHGHMTPFACMECEEISHEMGADLVCVECSNNS